MTCDTCRYRSGLECHLAGPKAAVVRDKVVTLWPTVAAKDWCGKWAPIAPKIERTSDHPIAYRLNPPILDGMSRIDRIAFEACGHPICPRCRALYRTDTDVRAADDGKRTCAHCHHVWSVPDES